MTKVEEQGQMASEQKLRSTPLYSLPVLPTARLLPIGGNASVQFYLRHASCATGARCPCWGQ